VSDKFVNLLPQEVEGLDLGVRWRLKTKTAGTFRVSLNASNLTKFGREPGPAVDALFAARAAGTINAATPLPESSNLLGLNGRPEWRGSGSLTWSRGEFQIGVFTQYISAVDETGFVDTNGVPWEVDAQLTGNLYFQFEPDAKKGWASNTRFRAGVRNLTNEQPPLASSGYLGSLYRPYGRYLYFSTSKAF
jgi:outer membrane receptor protein involved in Fe transport